MKYSEVVKRRVKSIANERDAVARGEDPRTVIKTGLRDFDSKAAIERGILTVIGSDTGMGKSTFKKWIQEFHAQRGGSCLDLSFEDPPARTADRSLSTLTLINNAKIGSPSELSDKEMEQLYAAVKNIGWADRIDYHYGLKTPEQALELLDDSDADLRQLDYAQVFPEGDKGLERTIADVAWKANEIAQRDNCAIIIYSQIKSDVQRRGISVYEAAKRRGGDRDEPDISGFRPFGNSDIAWAATLGQRAKMIGFLFRPGKIKRDLGHNAKDDRMELIFPKRNFGAEGTIVVGFDGKSSRLFNLEGKA